MRWRLDLSYDGTDFHGWAKQPGLRTVEGELTSAIAMVLRLEQQPSLVVAGRTDAGVHARGQVAHADLPEEAGPALLRRLPRVLAEDVVLNSARPAPPGFDARFSASWRRYCYRLSDPSRPADPLLRNWVAPVRRELDVAVLNRAAGLVRGFRDFAPFCRPRPGATTIRNLKEVRAEVTTGGIIEVHLLADAFCHSMVRSVVGALTAVASGQRDLAWLAEVVEHPSRHNEVHVMPARGLTLEEVGYPPADQLAARAEQARAVRSLEET